MIFSCIGHACFLIELDDGRRILTDPYDASCGYPVVPIPADIVLVSHGHHDHNAVETVPGAPRIIDQAGSYDLGDGLTVTAIEADHDDAGGAKRGKTLLFRIHAEGLTAVHLGDLGCLLTDVQRMQLGETDIAMIPVGGFFTIDAAQAQTTAEMLRARIVLPMHYRTRANADWPIAPVDDFVERMNGAEEITQLRVTAGDLMCQPRVAVLTPRSLNRA